MALTEAGSDILRAAVNLAKEYQCTNVASLKRRLVALYPDHEQDIDEALHFWGANLRKHYPTGV